MGLFISFLVNTKTLIRKIVEIPRGEKMLQRLFKKKGEYYVLNTDTFKEPFIITSTEDNYAHGYFSPSGVHKTIMINESVRKKAKKFEEYIKPLHPEKTKLVVKALYYKYIIENVPFSTTENSLKPYPHQIDAVYNHILNNRPIRFLLADDVGAGKTIMAGLTLAELITRGEVKNTLIIAPKSLINQWTQEFREKFGIELYEYDGASHRRHGTAFFEHHPFVIASMDFIKRDQVLENLSQIYWDFIIVDEAHKLATYNTKGKRYQMARTILPNTKNILLLTATPHNGNKEQFFRLVKLLNPDLPDDEHEISRYLRDGHYIRRTRKQFLDWDGNPLYVKRHVIDVPIEYSRKENELYNDIVEYVKRRKKTLERYGYSDKFTTLATIITYKRFSSSTRALEKTLERRLEKLSRAAGGTLRKTDPESIYITKIAQKRELFIEEAALLDEILRKARKIKEDSKIKKLTEILLEHPTDKIVVFTEYRDTLEYIKKELEARGYRVHAVHGGMSQTAREIELKKFIESGRVLVTTDVAGEGINLQAANIVVNYDLPWNPNRIEQRIGRVHRIGQKKDVFVYNFYAKGTIEEEVYKLLFEKLTKISAILGETTPYVLGNMLNDADFAEIVSAYIEGGTEKELMENDLEQKVYNLDETYSKFLPSFEVSLAAATEIQKLAEKYRVADEEVKQFIKDATKVFNIKQHIPEDAQKLRSPLFYALVQTIIKEHGKHALHTLTEHPSVIIFKTEYLDEHGRKTGEVLVPVTPDGRTIDPKDIFNQKPLKTKLDIKKLEQIAARKGSTTTITTRPVIIATL